MKTNEIHSFRFRMERPHQFGWGTWDDAIRNAREIEATYGLEVSIDLLDRPTALRFEREGAYFAMLTKRDWEPELPRVKRQTEAV